MKLNKFGMYVIIASFLIMSACGTAAQDNGTASEPTNEQSINQPVEKPIVANEIVNNEQGEEAEAFRNIKVQGEKGNYQVTGESRVFEGVFFYTVEDGHNELIEETKVEVAQGAPEWASFDLNISIPEDQLPLNGTVTLVLYEYSAKDNSVTHITNVKLEQILPPKK